MYICLDIGNVLCDVDFTDFIKTICTTCNVEGVEEEDVWFFLNRIQPLQDLGYTDMRNELRTSFGIRVERHPDVLRAWNESVRLNPVSARYLERFTKEFNVALLSNIGNDHNARIGNVIGAGFESCIRHMSCEIGMRKPHRSYYESFLDQNPAFVGAVYVDDRHENLAQGRRAGLDAHHLDTTKSTPEEIEAFWESIMTKLTQTKLCNVI